MEHDEEKQRLDKWLWAARFFKTRALAAEAVSGGKVHLNGERVKPARTVKVGDALSITRGQYVFHVVIQMLNSQRRPAKEAQQMYEESAESIQKRQEQMETNRALNASMSFSDRRPSKKERRHIVRFKRKQM